MTTDIAPQTQLEPQASLGTPRTRRRRWPKVAIAVLAIAVLIGGGVGAFANAQLSSTYSAGRAVTEYLAAMSRGDATYMLANGNLPKGDQGADDFLGSAAVTAMMKLSENRSIAGVKVSSVEEIDSTTTRVTVSMTWAGVARSQTYTVHKDPTRPHYVFYRSWRVDVPASIIKITLPVQPGGVGVDGIYGPPISTVSVIQGFHTVLMHETDFYDEQSQLVDASGGSGTASFAPGLSPSALTAATDTIREAFQPKNLDCDPRKAIDCVNHKYTPKAGYYEVLEMPGGNVSAYTTWMFTFTGDPSAGMQVVIEAAGGRLSVTGTCHMQLVADGNRKYKYHGPWSFTLTWSNGAFDWNGTYFCDKLKGRAGWRS